MTNGTQMQIYQFSSITGIAAFSVHKGPSQHSKSASEMLSPQVAQVWSSSWEILHLWDAVQIGHLLLNIEEEETMDINGAGLSKSNMTESIWICDPSGSWGQGMGEILVSVLGPKGLASATWPMNKLIKLSISPLLSLSDLSGQSDFSFCLHHLSWLSSCCQHQ